MRDRIHDRAPRSRARRCARRAIHAAALALLAPAPATALQVLTATDHAELAAQVSATAVSRIALEHDRIVRAGEGFALEHDPKRGDVYLRPLDPEHVPDATSLFLGTERGFTYRLTLHVAERDAAQVLIRNPAAETDTRAVAPTDDTHVAALVAFVRAVARREPPPGVVVEAVRDEGDLRPFPPLERWRGPRWTATVLAVDAATDAATLAAALGPGIAAAWVSEARVEGRGHRLGVAVSATPVETDR